MDAARDHRGRGGRPEGATAASSRPTTVTANARMGDDPELVWLCRSI